MDGLPVVPPEFPLPQSGPGLESELGQPRRAKAMSAAKLKIIADATCTACGCACDDIDLEVENNRIVAAERACPLGEAWFFQQPADERPTCLVDGQPAPLSDGIERAARILVRARYPLVYGLSGASCEAQRAAVGIADWIGGLVDTVTSTRHGPTGVSFQGVGEVTCSLGEVANRADLVIVWGCDPEESHPRHFSRYSLLPRGMFVPGGRSDRTLVVVDARPTKSTALADVFVQIAPGRDFEALWVLRALVQGVVLDAAEVERDTGVSLARWQELVERLKQARFGAMLYGSGLTMTRGGFVNNEALLALVRDMNAHTRLVAMSMRGGGNVLGADNVLTWRTGYPFGVNLARGYPRYSPGEYTAADVLERGEADAVLLVGADPLAELGPRVREHLARIPLVVVDPRDTPTARAASVIFTTATSGIHAGGTVYRMDDVPLQLRPALDSPHPSDAEVLAAIEERVKELQHAQ
jgi:formylmethanofuran dehydrogenase subunit B